MTNPDSRFVPRTLALEDQGRGDMLPMAEALAFVCTLRTSGQTPGAVLAADYDCPTIDKLEGEAAGSAEARRLHLPTSLRSTAPGAMTEPGIKVLLIEDDPTDSLWLKKTLAAARLIPFQVTQVTRLSTALQSLAAEH